MQFRHFFDVAAMALLMAAPAPAQTGVNVLVVANESAPGAVDIARRYMSSRRVPDDQLVLIHTPLAAEIARPDFDRQIQAPVAAWLAARSRQDRIHYIVLTRGIPLRIAGSTGRNGTVASVDSELTLLYRRMTGAAVPLAGPIENPYYAAHPDGGTPRPFNHAAYDIYLVTRLDGFTVADALGLIDRGAAPAADGQIVLDAPSRTSDPRYQWFDAAAASLSTMATRVVHETTSRAVDTDAGVLGYYSWGSNDPALGVRSPRLTFVPGAIAGMFLSSDARTFTEPPAGWTPGESGTATAYAGSAQSLIGDFVRAGVTGVSGQVEEPFLDGAVRPDVLFPSYLHGYNLAESYYRALPYLSWQTIIVGDPLCAPSGVAAGSADEADPPIDPETELPAQFSKRRLAAIQGTFLPAAVKRLMRSESRSARSDRAGTIEALKEAVAADSTLSPAWRLLAVTYEQERRYAEANDAYRQILAHDRNDIIALNNLAYNIAAREGHPDEALPLATRASTLAKGNPTIDDTLGWVHHLLGNTEEALRLLAPAARALPQNADVQLHAAAAYAAAGRMEEAAKALAAAAELDAALKEGAEFQDVQRAIRRGP